MQRLLRFRRRRPVTWRSLASFAFRNDGWLAVCPAMLESPGQHI